MIIVKELNVLMFQVPFFVVQMDLEIPILMQLVFLVEKWTFVEVLKIPSITPPSSPLARPPFWMVYRTCVNNQSTPPSLHLLPNLTPSGPPPNFD